MSIKCILLIVVTPCPHYCREMNKINAKNSKETIKVLVTKQDSNRQLTEMKTFGENGML